MEGGDGRATPLRSLVGFDRVFLEPGGSTTVVIEVNALLSFSMVEESGARWMKAGDRVVAVGGPENSARRRVRIVGESILMEE